MEKSRAPRILDRDPSAQDLWLMAEEADLARRLASIDEIRDWDPDWWSREIGLLLIEFRAKEKVFSDREEYEYANLAKGLGDQLANKLGN